MSADAAVGFLVSNLTQLLKYNADLIFGVKGDVEQLLADLGLLEGFVQDSSRKRRANPVLRRLVDQIRDVVYSAEDTVDTYVTLAAVQKARPWIERAFRFDHPVKLREVAVEIKTIRSTVTNLYTTKQFGLERLLIDDAGRAHRKVPEVEEDDVIGFDDEAETIINRLRNPSQDLQALTITGMAGLGKTTIANKIFKDLKIEFDFFYRIRAYISQEYNKKDVIIGMLQQICTVTSPMREMSDDDLVKELKNKLKEAKYIIFMDDVWTGEAWNDFKHAFPNNGKGSRILITSRNRTVAFHADPATTPHELKFLNSDESWKLLQRKVFGKRMCLPNSDLENPGKKIADKCKGVPLTIVVVAGILLDRRDIVDEWVRVAEGPLTSGKLSEVVQQSYDQLPYNLKACFLYFGVFPRGYEVPVWKLILLWIAEGFIKRGPNEDANLEAIAEGYLRELDNRNLVIVGRRKWNGQIKTCRVHDLLYDFCKEEAAEENFFREIKAGMASGDSGHFRRLAIHSDISRYISSSPSGERVRSLLCFSLNSTVISKENMSTIPGPFKLLRVLDVKPIRFPLFPADIAQLIHLRYIALCGDFKIVPKAISALWNLQTLIVDTSTRTLEIKADMWKMLQLRHVHSNASTILPLPTSNQGYAENFQTLSTISPESCQKEVLTKTPNLRKLGIRGKLSALFVEKVGSNLFENVGKWQQLENLKLLNDEFLGSATLNGAKLLNLPQAYRFPQKLKKLTLSSTYFQWTDMSILAMLPHLEVLKLKDYAFKGESWELQTEGGFRQLLVLHIERTNLMRWQASAHHFPRLRSIIIRNCSHLTVLPSELANVPSIHMIDLFCVTPEAAKCGKGIADKKNVKEFKLSIYPPDHWPM